MTPNLDYLSTLTVTQVTGVIGFFIYIASFSAVQIGMLSGNGVRYALANVIAASLVLVSLTADFNLASALIQISFISIGIFGIAKRLIRKPSRFNSQF